MATARERESGTEPEVRSERRDITCPACGEVIPVEVDWAHREEQVLPNMIMSGADTAIGLSITEHACGTKASG